MENPAYHSSVWSKKKKSENPSLKTQLRSPKWPQLLNFTHSGLFLWFTLVQVLCWYQQIPGLKWTKWTSKSVTRSVLESRWFTEKSLPGWQRLSCFPSPSHKNQRSYKYIPLQILQEALMEAEDAVRSNRHPQPTTNQSAAPSPLWPPGEFWRRTFRLQLFFGESLSCEWDATVVSCDCRLLTGARWRILQMYLACFTLNIWKKLHKNVYFYCQC